MYANSGDVAIVGAVPSTLTAWSAQAESGQNTMPACEITHAGHSDTHSHTLTQCGTGSDHSTHTHPTVDHTG